MERCLMIARSVTQAQRMARVLEQSGILCRWLKAPSVLSSNGCSYAIDLEEKYLAKALLLLEQNRLAPLQIYKKVNGDYEEVSP